MIVLSYVQELVKFAMTHEGASHVNILNSIIADAISPGLDENDGLDAKDRENISCLFLEVGSSIITLYHCADTCINLSLFDFSWII